MIELPAVSGITTEKLSAYVEPLLFQVTTVQWHCAVEVDQATRRRPIPSRNIASSSLNQLPVTFS